MAKTRSIRNCNDSHRVNQLSVHAERFFYRLMMEADDFGCFFADPRLIRSRLFPLMTDKIKTTDISKWITELMNVTNEQGEKAGLISLYEVDGKAYLEILNFGQRLDRATRKFPQKPISGKVPGSSGKVRESSRPEIEREIEVEREREEEDASHKKINAREKKFQTPEAKKTPTPSFAPPPSPDSPLPGEPFFWIGQQLIRGKPSEYLKTRDQGWLEVKLMQAFAGKDPEPAYREFDKRTGDSFTGINHFRKAFEKDFRTITDGNSTHQNTAGRGSTQAGGRKKFTKVFDITRPILREGVPLPDDPGGDSAPRAAAS